MRISYEGGTKFTAETRGHKITVDLPPEKGGTDTAMTPPELLAASLGTCIGVYVTAYCNQSGIDCEGLTVEVASDIVKDPMRISRLHAKVKVPKGVPENRRQAVKKVAGSCLIHATLCSLPELVIDLE